MSKRLQLVLSVLVVFTLILGVSSLSFAAKKKLTIWGGYPERLPVMQAAARDYMKENPDVEIEITIFDLRQSEQKLAISLMAGTAPDLFEGGHMFLSQYMHEDMLSTVPEKHLGWMKENFEQDYLDVFTRDGKIYGIPTVQGFQILFYNLDHYEEAGLTAPPQTLDELMDHARKLAKYDSRGNLVRSGISLRISGGGMGVAQKFDNFLFPNGGSVMEPTAPGKYKANFANEAGYKALNFHLQALHEYKVDSFDVKHDEEAFLLGTTSQFNRETYVIGELAEKAPNIRYGIAQIVGGDVQHATNLNADALVIPASGKNKDLAWDFAVFYNQDKYCVKMMDEVGWTMSRSHVDYSEVYAKEPHFEQALDRPEGMRMIMAPFAEAFNEVYTKFSDRLIEAFGNASLVNDKDKIMKFLTDAEKEINDIIKSYGEYAE